MEPVRSGAEPTSGGATAGAMLTLSKFDPTVSSTVLVDVVESVEPPQHVVPPAIGLQGIDGRHRCGRHQRCLFRLGRLVFDGRVGDREVHALERPRPTRADEHELICKMVEGGPRAVDDVPGDRPERGRCVTNLGDVVDHPAGVGIPLHSDLVRLRGEEGVHLAFQFPQVLACPFDPEAYHREPLIGCHVRQTVARRARHG